MKLATEQYKGYPVRFVEKVLGGKRLVVGEFPSKVTNKMLGASGSTKDYVFNQCKKMIDKEVKLKGLK
jgi:hypothetical protein